MNNKEKIQFLEGVMQAISFGFLVIAMVSFCFPELFYYTMISCNEQGFTGAYMYGLISLSLSMSTMAIYLSVK